MHGLGRLGLDGEHDAVLVGQWPAQENEAADCASSQPAPLEMWQRSIAGRERGLDHRGMRAFLAVAAILAWLFAAMLLFAPAAFYEPVGITLTPLLATVNTASTVPLWVSAASLNLA